MDVPGDQLSQEQMEALRMMQQQPGQQPGAGLMDADPTAMMMPPQGAGMNPYYVGPHMQQHYMPQPPMGQANVHSQTAKARLQCHACSKLLEYDAGAQYVQCFSCSTMNSVQQKTQVGGRVLSMLCAMCSTTNLAPYGINYVRCGTCHTISQVSHAYRVELQAPQPMQTPMGGPVGAQQQHRGPPQYAGVDQVQMQAAMQQMGADKSNHPCDPQHPQMDQLHNDDHTMMYYPQVQNGGNLLNNGEDDDPDAKQ